MSQNVLATSNVVCKKALMVLENMLEFSSNINRDYESEFAGGMARGYAPGNTINIKRPPRFAYRDGRVAAPQSTTETTIPLTLSQGGVDIYFNSSERTLSLTRLEDKLQAAMASVVNEIDRRCLEMVHYQTFNALNPALTSPNTQTLALDAITSINQRLDEMAARRDKQRSLTLSPSLNAKLITGFAGLFNNQSKLSEQYGSGVMVDSLGIKYHMDQNIATHTNGAATATNINGSGQFGNTLTVVATTGGTLTRGTIITLPGVFAVNPQSRGSTGSLAQFIVTADVPVGSTSIPISPAIIPSGVFQNVTASPTTGQPYAIFGAASTSYTCSVGYHKDAFTLASVPMWMPPKGNGVVDVHQEQSNGLNLKVTEGYDFQNDVSVMRIDILWGIAATYPELSVKYAL